MSSIFSFFVNPFLYVILFLIFMHYRRQILFERKLFHVRINTVWEQMSRSLLFGLLGGLAASAMAIGLGAVIRPLDLLIVLAISLVLSFFHIQYLCICYSGGLLAFLSYLASLWPQGQELPWLSWLWTALLQVNGISLLAIIAVLHIVEAALLSFQRGRGATPLVVTGRRGLLVGACQVQHFWMIPLLAVTPVPPNAALGFSFPEWWPLLSAGAGIGFGFTLLPLVIGYSDLAVSSLPHQKAKRSSVRLLLYSVILLLLALGAVKWEWLLAAASLFAVAGHEGLIRLGRWVEWKRKPIFTQLGRGVVVLAVVPKSPADQMGIQAGDIILKINGREIARQEDIYPALQLQSAFCKMEVQNPQGHIKYLQRTVYQGEHHELGLIAAPDEKSPYYVDIKPVNLIKLISQRIDQGA